MSSTSSSSEDRIQNGVTFLSHPKVQHAPLEERKTFLRNKGLTEDEINEAVRRLSTSKDVQDAEQISPQPQQIRPPVVPPTTHAPSWASSWLVPGTLALSAGAGMAFLYKTLTTQNDGITPWQQLQQQFGNNSPKSPSHRTNERSLPGAPGAVDALEAMGKPVPTQAEMSKLKQEADLASSTSESRGNYGHATYESKSFGYSSDESKESKQIKAVVEQQTEILQEIGNALRELSSQIKSNNSATPVTASVAESASIAVLSQQTADLKAELNTIKTLLLMSNKVDPASLAPLLKVENTPEKPDHISALDSLVAKTARTPEPSEETPSTETVNYDEVRKEKMVIAREWLVKLSTECEEDKLLPAVGMLLMYLGNLVKDPDVPRYRKIARTNASYQNSLGNCPFHLEFLKANGFEEKSAQAYVANRASTLEWSEEWRTNKSNWALDVLKDSIKNLEQLRNDHSKKGARASTPATTSSEVPPIIPTPTMSSKVDLLDERKNTEAVKGATEDVIDEQSLSYGEVMKLVQEGREDLIPGIKKIPNTLSVDAENPPPPSSSTVPKPWELGEQETPAVDYAVDVTDDADSGDYNPIYAQ